MNAQQAKLANLALAFRKSRSLDTLREGITLALAMVGTEEQWDTERSWNALLANLAKRERKAGTYRWLASAPKDLTDDGRHLRDAMRWHTGNGSLWGAHTAGMMLGDGGADRNRADTLAIVLLAILGRSSTAVGAWVRTGVIR